MSGYFDSCGDQLSVDDYVLFRTRRDELFQVQAVQFPADAIIRNVLPGGRLGTSTVPCRELTRAINNPPRVAPEWFDTRFEQPDFTPVAGTVLACGCHIRGGDFEAILCPEHLIEANS